MNICGPADDQFAYSSTIHTNPNAFTFSFAGPSRIAQRLAKPVLQTFGFADKPEQKCERGDDEANDQYTIKNNQSMCWAVLCKNDTGRLHPNSILGDFGHAERLPAWLHIVGGAVFLIYAILRPIVVTEEHTLAESLTTSAVVAVSFCFFSSAVYHITSPSQSLAFWTRQLDFLGIYTALAVGALADFAIATRSFQNVSIISIIDIPLACVLVGCFFFMRRGLTPSSETWASFLGGCTLNFGLFRRMHLDRVHTGARQSTSFILAIAYFTTVPAVFRNFGSTNGMTLLSIEIAALLALALGMVLDNGLVWPDVLMSRGKGPRFLVCKNAGCVGSAHTLWHMLTVVAAVKSSVGREVALGWQ
tara:strand:- start:14 stop:1096 length:1083 start_codon:yes stop_codon:yes gene_type:complete